MSAAEILRVDPAVVARLRGRRARWWPAIAETANVIGALVLRESATRYGSSRLGYLWAFIEPLVLLSLFLLLRVYLRDRIAFGESALLFIASGFLTVRIFVSITRQMLTSITQNSALMTFPSIVPLDLVIARFMVEMLTMGTVIAIFYLLVVNVSDVAVIHDPIDFTIAVAVLFLLGGGVGMLNAGIGVLWSGYGRIFGFLSFPLLICSGVFYLPSSLSPDALAVLSWNPVLHSVEWLREAIYLDYVSVLDRSYPIVFSTVCMGLGLVMVRLVGSRVAD